MGLMSAVIPCSAAAIVLLAGCASVQSTEAIPKKWDYCYRQLQQHTFHLMGEAGADCGFVTLRSTPRERAASRACALSMTEAGLPFRVGYQDIGTDSGFCEVAVRTRKRRWIVLEVDYDRTGGVMIGDGPVLSVLTCERVEIHRDHRALFSGRDCDESRSVRDDLFGVEH